MSQLLRQHRSACPVCTVPALVPKLLPLLALWILLCQSIFSLFADQAAAQVIPYTLHLASVVANDQRLIDFGDAQQLVFQSKDGKSLTAATFSIVRWGAWRPPHGVSAVWLSDGSWLVGRLEFRATEKLVLQSDWFQSLEIPLSLCRGIVLTPPVSVAAWYPLESKLLSASGDRDFLWLNTGEQQAGILKWPNLSAQDPANDSNAMFLSLASAGQTQQYSLNELRSIVFCPSLHPPFETSQVRFSLGMRDGSLLHIRRFQRTATGRLRIDLGLPISLETLDPHHRFTQAVDYLASSPANVTWLSDLEPARFRHASQSSIEWPLGRDRDLFNRPLLLNERIVKRGLAMHSASQATYRRDGQPGKFLSEIRLAEPPEGGDSTPGSVECKVLVARGGKLEAVFTSPTLRRQSPPLPVEVDISGAQLVVLLTEMADLGQLGDHVLWLDARFAKTE